MRHALVTYGGWDGHQPRACAEWVAELLSANGFAVDLSAALGPLPEDLTLIVPVWSIATAEDEELDALIARVEAGTGLAAFHGAAATFNTHNSYRHLLGGTFVWHPEERAYIVDPPGNTSFEVFTEQYYMHTDPANDVTATTTFADGTVMPVAWRRRQGEGRIFYSSLGHSPEVLGLDLVTSMFLEGALWAAKCAAPADHAC